MTETKQAVILAGGKGSRLAPFNTVLPKPLMPLGDYSILEIVLRQLDRAGFAEAVLAASALARRPSVRRIASADYPTPARRPANSALDCARIRATYGIEQPDWRASLARVIRELEATA